MAGRAHEAVGRGIGDNAGGLERADGGEEQGAAIGKELRQAAGTVALGTTSRHEHGLISIAEGHGIAGEVAGVAASAAALYRRWQFRIEVINRIAEQLDDVLAVVRRLLSEGC
ncbi:MAG: hypothetical protein ABIL11_18430 [Chloroflexota bacterium]